MVIGLSFRLRLLFQVGAAVLLCLLPVRRAAADDTVILKAGSTVTGQVTGVSDGQLTISTRTPNGGTAQLTFYLADIRSIEMAPPAAVAQLKDASPAQVIATLQPIVKEYAGLPADWVVDAMGQLADAYDTSGQSDRAAAAYAEINQFYPDSPYQNEAVAGTAKLDLQQGKIDAALALLRPLVDKANQDLAPSPAEGRLYANVFLVYGQALQAQKHFSQALEAYLTVKTMFYQNPALADRADQLAKALQAQNPGVGVD
jgi:tetratricopeptide (TPR) repeat protein